MITDNIEITSPDSLRVGDVEIDLHNEMAVGSVSYNPFERRVEFNFSRCDGRYALVVTGEAVEHISFSAPKRDERDNPVRDFETVLMFCWTPSGYPDRFDLYSEIKVATRDYDLMLVTESGLQCKVNIGRLRAEIISPEPLVFKRPS